MINNPKWRVFQIGHEVISNHQFHETEEWAVVKRTAKMVEMAYGSYPSRRFKVFDGDKGEFVKPFGVRGTHTIEAKHPFNPEG